jgi:hydroxyacylglutathione hydrolase
LPNDTQVFPDHDCIENNLRFSLARVPDNADAQTR